eukprot:TRINITY_DN30042_c0_g1_i1.p1 TRINITY_DN30042_c0_g1~~TRINITY_DN30042_c0_g1_i1.p1  ORF type:complete len:322 (-),score=82.17 TRINITY_DN30042_c0_g1_i1:112-1044(-)
MIGGGSEEEGRQALLSGAPADEGAGAPAETRGAASGPLRERAAEFDRLLARANAALRELKEGARDGAEAEVVSLTEEMEALRRRVQVQLRLGLSGASATVPREDWERLLQDWSREASTVRASLAAAREERARAGLGLGGSGGGASGYVAPAAGTAGSWERRSAERTTDLLEQGSLRLQEARRQAAETEAIGQGVLSDLAEQRETIQHVRDNMGVVSAELLAARRSIDRMLRAAQQNQLIAVSVMAFFCIGLAFWGLTALGLSVKHTLLLAVTMVLIAAAAVTVRRRAMLRKAAADEEEAYAEAEFHRAPL